MSRGINAIPLLLLLALPLFGDPATVTGNVLLAGTPLPGCWVILESKSVSRRTATDANGAFKFTSVAPGAYDVKYEFSDFVPARQKVEVVEGTTEVPAQELTMVSFESGGLDCTLPCAIGREPVWPSDRPSCADYDFNDALIEGVKLGDRSAIELLRQRYDKTFAAEERRRIGHALLRRVEDDSIYWHELIASAENAVRYPSDHDPIAFESLKIAAADPRSHALMIEALASDDAQVVALGIESLGRQHDEASLGLIGKAKQRLQCWVTGNVTIDGVPSSGCVMKLDGVEVTTDEVGCYFFDHVAPGSHELSFEVEGLIHATQWIEVVGGPNVIPTEEMNPEPMALTAVDCDDEETSRWFLPKCSDSDLDTSLIAALDKGDLSAAKLLEQRRTTVDNYSERQRIADALLQHGNKDAALWDELYADAVNCLRFDSTGRASSNPEYIRFCEEHGYDTDGYSEAAYRAVFIIRKDSRAHALMLQALKAEDESIVALAVNGLAQQGDLKALDAIDQAIRRFDPGRYYFIASTLTAFHSPAADAVAMRFIKEDRERAQYRDLRDDPEH